MSQPSLLRELYAEFSALQPYREYASTCSYCRRPDAHSRVAYGMQTSRMTVVDYEDLSENNFIRSGSHVYQPINERSCCPNLGIKCDAPNFLLHREQAKVLHGIQEMLLGHKPILLPPTDDEDDVLAGLLRLAEAGMITEAATSVCTHKKAGVKADLHDHDEHMETDADEGSKGTTVAGKPPGQAAKKGPDPKKRLSLAVTLADDRVLAAEDLTHSLVTLAAAAAMARWLQAVSPTLEALTDLLQATSVTAAGAAEAGFISNCAFILAARFPGSGPSAGGGAGSGTAATGSHKGKGGAGGAVVARQLEIASALVQHINGDATLSTWLKAEVKGPGALHITPNPAPAKAVDESDLAAARTKALELLAGVSAGASPTVLRERLAAVVNADAHARISSTAVESAAGAPVTCLTANSPEARKALADKYRTAQEQRQRDGMRAFVVDPTGYRFRGDDDDGAPIPHDLITDDELDVIIEDHKAESDGSSSAASLPSLTTREEKLAYLDTLRQRSKDKKLSTEISKSEDALRKWMEDKAKHGEAGMMGGYMRALKRRAEDYARAHAGEEAGAAATTGGIARKVPKKRAPKLPSSSPTVSADTTDAPAGAASSTAAIDPSLLLPFGRGPHTLRVRLRKPNFTLENWELYTRFNMNLHYGCPGDNTPERYKGHLVRSPLVYQHPSDIGYLYKLACGFQSQTLDNVERAKQAGHEDDDEDEALADAFEGDLKKGPDGLWLDESGHPLLFDSRGDCVVKPPAAVTAASPAASQSLLNPQANPGFFEGWTLPRKDEAAAAAIAAHRLLLESPRFETNADSNTNAVPPPSLFESRPAIAAATAFMEPAEGGSLKPPVLYGLATLREKLLRLGAAFPSAAHALQPSVISSEVLRAIAAADPLAGWTISTVARKWEIRERKSIADRVKAAKASFQSEVVATGAPALPSSSAAVAAASSEGDRFYSWLLTSKSSQAAASSPLSAASSMFEDDDDGSNPSDRFGVDFPALPLVQAIPPIPACLDDLVGSAKDIVEAFAVHPATFIMVILWLCDSIYQQADGYLEQLRTYELALANCDASTGEEASPLHKRAKTDEAKAEDAVDEAEDEEAALMAALLKSLEEMLGVRMTADELEGMDPEFIEDMKVALRAQRAAQPKTAAGAGVGAGPTNGLSAAAQPSAPKRPAPPVNWLSSQRLFPLLQKLLTSAATAFSDPQDPSGKMGGLGSGASGAAGGFKWLLSAAISTFAAVRDMVRKEADQNRYRPAHPHATASPPSVVAAAGAGSASASLPATDARPLDKYFVRASVDSDYQQNDGRVQVEGWDLPMGFGTFFHEYWLVEGSSDHESSATNSSASAAAPEGGPKWRETLLAVSVIDLMPTRLASVYFFYNTSFRHLQLGKLSALTEIWLTQQLFDYLASNPQVMGLPVVPQTTAAAPGPLLPPALFRWWDANLIVHACSTMSYKRRFAPSRLLCPRLKRSHWVDLTAPVLLALDEDFSAPLGTQPSWDGQTEVTPERYSLSLPAASAAAAKEAALKRAEQARNESEALAGDLETQDALEAEEVLSETMQVLPSRKTDAITFGMLSDSGKELLERAMMRFMRAAGPNISQRVLFDPAWMASLESRQKNQREELKEFKEKKKAEKAAAEQAAAAAAAAVSAQAAASSSSAPALPSDSTSGMQTE